MRNLKLQLRREYHGGDNVQMSWESIEVFLQAQESSGASAAVLRQRKCFVVGLYQWLPEDKCLSREILLRWREAMEAQGYSRTTVENYVKGINRYLDFMGWSELRFNRGKAKDLTGQTFGDLMAIEATGDRDRKDIVWKCRCKCGKVVQLPATRLLTGNTTSCGCRKSQQLKAANKNFADTNLRISLEERVKNPHSVSGYIGVSLKRDKWLAYINYRGKRYRLGLYSRLEDAVKARARAKQLVQEDAQRLLELYEDSNGIFCEPSQ